MSPQSSQRLERLVDLCDSVLDGKKRLVRSPHIRHVLPRDSVFYPICTCGWLGTPCLCESDALSCECECEAILTDSAERARRILRG